MIDQILQRCWVAAVIRDDDGNVLVARWADTQAWDLPSGTLRVGEDVCTGVRRVVADSVSLGVSVGWLAEIHAHVRDGMTLVFLPRHSSDRSGRDQMSSSVTRSLRMAAASSDPHRYGSVGRVATHAPPVVTSTVTAPWLGVKVSLPW